MSPGIVVFLYNHLPLTHTNLTIPQKHLTVFRVTPMNQRPISHVLEERCSISWTYSSISPYYVKLVSSTKTKSSRAKGSLVRAELTLTIYTLSLIYYTIL